MPTNNNDDIAEAVYETYVTEPANYDDNRFETFMAGWNAALEFAAEHGNSVFTTDAGGLNTMIDKKSILKYKYSNDNRTT